jgi:hypothetical protein
MKARPVRDRRARRRGADKLSGNRRRRRRGKPKSLIELLDTFDEPLGPDEQFPEIEDLPPGPVDI